MGVFNDLSDIQYIYLLNVIMQLQALRAFEGGPETFLSLSGVSHITGYESVHDRIEVQSATQYHHQLAVQSTLGSPFSFESMFRDFLTDQGIPCPETFATIASSFNSVIDLSQIDTPAFRSRMLLLVHHFWMQQPSQYRYVYLLLNLIFTSFSNIAI